MTKRISVLLILCLSLYITTIAFHHHEDHAVHDECGLCLALSVHSSLIRPSILQVSTPVISIEFVPQERVFALLNFFTAPHGDRAPPLP